MQISKNHKWSNWAGNFSSEPLEFFQPVTESELVEIVKRALQAQKKIRVAGASRSFSPVVYTNDYLVSLDNYNKIIKIDKENKTVVCQAGILLGDLFSALKENGLSVKNCGVINKMTLAGALSTGTHGSGISHSIISSNVISMRLVTGTGAVIVLDTDEPEKLNAARVALGTLGIISEVCLQLESLFFLQSKEYSISFSEMLINMKSMALRSEYTKFWWFPHTNKVHVFEIDRIAGEAVKKANPSFFTPLRYLLYKLLDPITGPLFKLTHVWSYLTVWVNRLSRVLFFSKRIRTGVATDVLVVDEAVPMIVSEFALDFDASMMAKDGEGQNKKTKKHESQIDKTLEDALGEVPAHALYEFRNRLMAQKLTLHFPVDIRFANSDEAWLSACYKRRSVYIGMCVREYKKPQTPRIMELFQQVMLEHGGRPHWGKLTGMRSSDFIKAFPKWDDFLRLRKKFDPHNLFINKYIDEWFFS